MIKTLAKDGQPLPGIPANMDKTAVESIYQPIFASIKETDLALLTATESYLLGYAFGMGKQFEPRPMMKYLRLADRAGAWRGPNAGALQSTNRLDRSMELHHLSLAKDFTNALPENVTAIGTDIPLSTLPENAYRDVISGIVKTAQKAFGIKQEINIVYQTSDYANVENAHYMLSPTTGDLNVYPKGRDQCLDSAIGILGHECMHALQREQTAKIDPDGIITQGDRTKTHEHSMSCEEWPRNGSGRFPVSACFVVETSDGNGDPIPDMERLLFSTTRSARGR